MSRSELGLVTNSSPGKPDFCSSQTFFQWGQEAVHGPMVPSIHSRHHGSRWEARQLRKADPIWAFHIALLKATVEKSPKPRLLTVLQLVSEMYLPMKLFPGCRVFPSSSQTVSTKVRWEKDTALAQLPPRFCAFSSRAQDHVYLRPMLTFRAAL